jgi:hypothetical protein
MRYHHAESENKNEIPAFKLFFEKIAAVIKVSHNDLTIDQSFNKYHSRIARSSGGSVAETYISESVVSNRRTELILLNSCSVQAFDQPSSEVTDNTVLTFTNNNMLLFPLLNRNFNNKN